MLLSLTPHEYQTNKQKFDRVVMFENPDIPSFLANVIRFVSTMPPQRFESYGRSFACYVDASLDYVGISSLDGKRQSTVAFGSDIQRESPIVVKEMIAVWSTISRI